MAPTNRKEATGRTATSPVWKRKRLSSRFAPSRRGFTLVETLVVVVVVALLTAMVAMRWSGVHHRATAQATLVKLQFVDQHLRQFASSRRQQCLLAFDMEKGRMGKRYEVGERSEPKWETLGTGVRIDAIRVGAEKPTTKQVEILVDVNGQTPTYGLHLLGPGKRETWLLFAGVSGQMIELKNRSEWNGAFELLAPSGL